MTPVDALVVGAGVHGLCTAFWLRRLGVPRVVVVDRYGPGHAAGSSHGALRITRSSYHDPQLVRLATRAHREGWPQLEAELGRPLRVATPGLFFGPPDGPFGAWLRATLAASGEVEQVSPAQARRLCPLLRIDDGDAALLDRSAAMVLAGETMAALRAWCAAHAVDLRWHEPVTRIAAEGRSVRVTTARAEYVAGAAAVAAGAWLDRLLPGGSGPLTVLRQQVGYFDLDVPDEAVAAGRFPVWARIGRTADDFVYGLPAHGGAGVKAARHVTAGAGVDPDAPPPPVDEHDLLALARERFAVPVRALSGTETCLYTMTRDQGFAVGPAAGEARLVAIAACSGHAFKFAPEIGRAAADALHGALAAARTNR